LPFLFDAHAGTSRPFRSIPAQPLRSFLAMWTITVKICVSVSVSSLPTVTMRVVYDDKPYKHHDSFCYIADSPLATNVPVNAGKAMITVPNVKDGDKYIVDCASFQPPSVPSKPPRTCGYTKMPRKADLEFFRLALARGHFLSPCEKKKKNSFWRFWRQERPVYHYRW
jgi:hypothetical protein